MTIQVFDEQNFADALSNAYTKPEAIKIKNHFQYFKDYLGNGGGLNAQYMVIEENYISKDYLHDYATYYAFCFENYPKFCKRIHFFNTTVTAELLNKAILGTLDSPVDFWSSYLGFIVVKPIPTTVIGFTVLKDYNSSNNKIDRHFWGLRYYKVHVFGHELEINSLAFQEQDTVLAACATTAIWSMLNKASTDSHTILKSPNQITRDAANISSDGSRLFPNKGLSVLQICQAIFNSGLVSEVKTMQPSVTNLYTKKILNAYSPIGIPIILVIKVPEGIGHGLHAITVSGYNQSPPSAIAPKPDISWHAENIDRIYAHDDQFGPFVRINFKDDIDLITPWTDNHPQHLPTNVTNIIIPLYPKIRITYEDIEFIVRGLDAILSLFFKNKIKYDLVWDIKIQFSENFKKGLLSIALDEEKKLTLLKKSMPKYIWSASCYMDTSKVFEFTFDATDVSSNMIAEDLIWYLPDTEKEILHEYLTRNRSIFESTLIKKQRQHYYEFLLNRLS